MEQVKHPSHYNGECPFECWDLMEMAFGTKALYYWCVLNAFKYCYRCKAKHPDNPTEDLMKAKQCLDKAAELNLGYGDIPEQSMFNAMFLTDWIDAQLKKYSGEDELEMDK